MEEPGIESLDVLLVELRARFQEVGVNGRKRATEMLERIAGLEQDLREMEALVISAERQASRLANLYVAAYQLHASLDPVEVRGAVGEIAINLLGAGECALLTRLDVEVTGHDVVNLVSDAELPAPFAGSRYGGGDALVDACLSDGTLRFGPTAGSRAIAVVPLAAQGTQLGALVVLRLLPHKAGLHTDDRELLDLLGAHAASALLAAHVFTETQRKLRTLEGLVSLLRRPS
jgi:GAF domain-containing protein